MKSNGILHANQELKTMCTSVFLDSSWRYYDDILMEGLSDTTKSLNKDVTSSGRESNPQPPIHTSYLLNILPISELICSFRAS